MKRRSVTPQQMDSSGMKDAPASLYPFIALEALSVSAAAARAGVSVGTIRNWCDWHSIGRKIGGVWKVSKVALQMYLDGDRRALELYLAGDRTDDRVRAYYQGEGITLARTIIVSKAS